MDVAAQVKQSLIHYNLWTNVELFSSSSLRLLRGKPPGKLVEQDPDDQYEWVASKSMQDAQCTMDEIEDWFSYIALIESRPRRVTLALVNDDGTVVYYFVHDGITAPRQN